MADILLTHSNHLYSDRKQVRKMQPYPPLQTLLAASLLREGRGQQWDPEVVDALLEVIERELQVSARTPLRVVD